MRFSEYILTDGTTKINLLSLNKHKYGIGIDSYTPGRSQPKDGGVWQDSALAPGRRLVYQTFANVVDTLNIKIAYPTADALTQAQSELDMLLAKALAYWTVEWQDEPVWIQATTHGDSQRRYALIYGVSMGEYADPYAEPMAGSGPNRVASNLTLGLERSMWLGNPPGTGTAVQVSHRDSEATSAVFIGNAHTVGLTQIRRHRDAPTDLWSENLLLGGLSTRLLFTDTIGLSYETTLYIGSSTQFNNLQFDIDTAGFGYNVSWAYSDGADGYIDNVNNPSDIIVADGTNGFKTAGANTVSWTLPGGGWFPQALDVFGSLYWMRVKIEEFTEDPEDIVFPAQDPGVPIAALTGTIGQARSFYVGDQPGTPFDAWSANLLTPVAPSYDLFDQEGLDEGGNLEIYFGSPVPFTSIVFNLGALAQNLDIVWEISDGVGGYIDVTDIGGSNPIRDDTNATGVYGNSFTVAGQNIVQWVDDQNFRPQALESFGTLYWIRARNIGVFDPPEISPTQITRQPYTAKVPYVEIAENQVLGDLDALASIRLSTKSRANSEIILPQSILVGLRSIYRSGLYCGDFSAYINMRAQDNPSGVTIDLTGTTSHANPATLNSERANTPSGYAVIYTGTAGDVLDEVFRVNFAPSVVRQFYGRYRLFAKFNAFTLDGTSQLRARVKFEDAFNEVVGVPVVLNSDSFPVGPVYLADLGYFRIPPSNMVSIDDQSITVSLIIDAMCADAGVISFYELILMPVDEWSAVTTGTTTSETGDFVMDIDAIEYPKEPNRALLRSPGGNQVIDSFPLIANQNVGVHARTQQRLWFLMLSADAHFGMSALTSVQVNPRFYNQRRG